MIERVKNWLGIEGVKMELDIPLSIPADKYILYGILHFTSLREQYIESLSFSLIETYKRGRGDNKRINDNLLAHEIRDVQLHIREKSNYAYPFELNFNRFESNIDQLSKKLVLRPFTKTVKWINGVKSSYVLHVSAQIKGNKLQPHIRQQIKLS